MMNDDMELVREYASTQSEAAFETLVSRHLNLVYSSALRQVADAHLAQDIAQAVFIILAQKAKSLGSRTILSGWLYHATRYASADALKTQRRRQNREQEVFMQSVANPPAPEVWLQIAPLLDEAMAHLDEKDRNLIVLRFFENKSAREIADTLGLEPLAAQKRVTRAVEKLRAYFAKRHLPHTAAVIAESISVNSVCLAPAGLAKTIAVVAAAKGAAAGGSTLTLVKGALKIMAWTKAKSVLVIGAGLLLAAATSTVIVLERKPFVSMGAYPWQAEGYPSTNTAQAFAIKDDVLLSAKAPALLDIQPTVAPNGGAAVAVGSDDEVKRVGFGYTVQEIVMTVYGFDDVRTVVATSLPTNRYDFIDNLSHGATQAFKDAIRKKFGVAGRIAAIKTNVFLLKLKTPDAPGLRPGKPGSANLETSSMGPNSQERHTTGDSFTKWVGDCEKTLQTPVLDRTGLTGNYDVDLKWKWGNGQSEKDAFRQAALDQLGLELVPSREEINVLVIEKNTKPFTPALAVTNQTTSKPFSQTAPQLIMPKQVYYPKASWAFAGYASPEAALQTYFWAINKGDMTNFKASMTVGAQEEFTKTLHDAGETEDHFFKETTTTTTLSMLRKVSGYRIMEIQAAVADEVDIQIVIDGGTNKSDTMTIKKVGAEWKVDESP
jgi:uncharacterized protein (TIGR03435 family)